MRRVLFSLLPSYYPRASKVDVCFWFTKGSSGYGVQESVGFKPRYYRYPGSGKEFTALV